MLLQALTLRRLGWLVCACCLLFPLSAAAEGLQADLDGDGRRDTVVADARGQVLTVWLSKSGRTQRIHTTAQPRQVIAADLDGDDRPELIWSDQHAQIHVLKRKHRKFRPAPERHARPSSSRRHQQRDGEQAEPDSADVSGISVSPACAIASASSVVASPLVGATNPLAAAWHPRSRGSHYSFVTRPPPSLTPRA